MTRAALLLLLCAPLHAQDMGLDLPVERPTYDPQSGIRPTNRHPAPPSPPSPEAAPPRDVPPPVFFGEEIRPDADALVYVLDQSGSMWPSRWPAAVRETIRSVMGLAGSVRFDVVTYHCSWRSAFGELRRATAENKAEALAWLARQKPGGNTGTGPAVADTLRGYGSTVVLLTDGAPNCPWNYGSDLRHLGAIGDAAAGNPVNVFGVEATGGYRAFCVAVASVTGGTYYDVRGDW